MSDDLPISWKAVTVIAWLAFAAGWVVTRGVLAASDRLRQPSRATERTPFPPSIRRIP